MVITRPEGNRVTWVKGSPGWVGGAAGAKALGQEEAGVSAAGPVEMGLW